LKGSPVSFIPQIPHRVMHCMLGLLVATTSTDPPSIRQPVNIIN